MKLPVRDHIPLKQGLRPLQLKVVSKFAYVRDHIPLKQGLRLKNVSSLAKYDISQRPYSIKTRIKT